MTKSGWKTTEFWVTVATDIGVIATAATGVLPVKYAAIAAGIAQFGYALSRGLTKITPPAVAVTGVAAQTTAPVAPVPPQA